MAAALPQLGLLALLTLCGCMQAVSAQTKFSQDVYSFEVNETAPAGQVLGSVTATQSRASSSTIAYRIVNSTNTGEALVSLNASSGLIRTLARLDREALPDGVNLTIAADELSGSGVRLSTSTAVVRVTILDFNDNAPVLLSNRFLVQRTLAPGSRIGRIEAVDPDAVSGVTYHVQAVAATSWFALNESSGVLTLRRSVPSALERAVISVRARDTQFPYLTSSVQQYTIDIGLIRAVDNATVQPAAGTIRRALNARKQPSPCLSEVYLNSLLCAGGAGPQVVGIFAGFTLGCTSQPMASKIRRLAVSIDGVCAGTDCDTLLPPGAVPGFQVTYIESQRAVVVTGYNTLSGYVGVLGQVQYQKRSTAASSANDLTLNISMVDDCDEFTLRLVHLNASSPTPVIVAVNQQVGRVMLTVSEESPVRPYAFGALLRLAGGPCGARLMSVTVQLDYNGSSSQAESLQLAALAASRHQLTVFVERHLTALRIVSNHPGGSSLADFEVVLRTLQYHYSEQCMLGPRPVRHVSIGGQLADPFSNVPFPTTVLVITVRKRCRPELVRGINLCSRITPYWSRQLPSYGGLPLPDGLNTWVPAGSSVQPPQSGSCRCRTSSFRRAQFCTGSLFMANLLENIAQATLQTSTADRVLRLKGKGVSVDTSSHLFAGQSNAYFYVNAWFRLLDGDSGGVMFQLVAENTTWIALGANASMLWYQRGSHVRRLALAASLPYSSWHQLVLVANGVRTEVFLNRTSQGLHDFVVMPETFPANYSLVIGSSDTGLGVNGYRGDVAGVVFGTQTLLPSHLTCLFASSCTPCFFGAFRVAPAYAAVVDDAAATASTSLTVTLMAKPTRPQPTPFTTAPRVCHCSTKPIRKFPFCTGHVRFYELLLGAMPPFLSSYTSPSHRHGLSVRFNGKVAYAVSRDQIDLSGQNNWRFTLSSWVFFTPQTRGYVMALSSTSVTRIIGVYIDGVANRITIYLGSISNPLRFDTTQAGWHHLTVTRDGPTVKLFVDETLIGTQTSGLVFTIPTTYYLLLGARPHNDVQQNPTAALFRLTGSLAGLILTFQPTTDSAIRCLANPCGTCLLTKPSRGVLSAYDGTSRQLTLTRGTSATAKDVQDTLRSLQFVDDLGVGGLLQLSYNFTSGVPGCDTTATQNIAILP